MCFSKGTTEMYEIPNEKKRKICELNGLVGLLI